MSSELIYGIHAVKALLEQAPERFIEAWVLKGRDDDRLQPLLATLQQYGVSIQYVQRKTLDDKAEGAIHQGIIAKVKEGRKYDESDLDKILEKEQTPFFLVLDGVTDPHNLGACLRTAESCGVHGVIAPRDKSAALTPVARKTASGAAEVLPFFQVTNLARTLKQLADDGIWCVGTALTDEAKPIYDIDLKGPLAIVMGAEGSGMRRLTREHCDALAYIPMQGTVQSLNVSVATGVALYEAFRQRRPA